MRNKTVITATALALSLGACFAQTKFFAPGGLDQPEEQEIIINRSTYQGNGIYYHTPTYNDIFLPNPYNDQFVLPSGSLFYHDKKVAEVNIFNSEGKALFTLHVDANGMPGKTVTIDGLTREQDFYHDNTGNNKITVQTFRRDGQVLRVDSTLYNRQRKVINDTAYAYTVVRTLVYKTGSFLNAQNDFYNKTYGGDQQIGYFMPVVVKARKNKGNHPLAIKPPKLFACNYATDQLYFSREELSIDQASFTFNGAPFNPGEEALKQYVPEYYAGTATRRSELPSERYVETTFLRQSMRCGYSTVNSSETAFYQAVRYSYTQNSKGLRDSCYHGSGGQRGMMYYFTYKYYE